MPPIYHLYPLYPPDYPPKPTDVEAKKSICP